VRRLLIILGIVLFLIALSVGRMTGTSSALAFFMPQAPRLQRVPVLLYHHLVPGVEEAGEASMPTPEFRRQMAQLHAEGYQTINTEQMLDWLEGRITIPAKSVLITFDDGYASVYAEAWPILQEFGFGATTFIISSQIGKTPGIYPHLSSAQMDEMRQGGQMEFQDHSFNAHHLTDGRPALTVWSEEAIAQDLEASQAAFAEASLPRPQAFAYPFGAWQEPVIRQLKAAGYRLGFAGEAGLVQRGDDPMLLKRIVAYPGMTLP
jgi:peptidoglycan/xylan/chitin deacetylase (PgdA/CDA1 family)